MGAGIASGKEEIMGVTIIYNKYTSRGTFVGEREYTAKSDEDYNRVMEIIERNPDQYEVVNEYFN